jgi:hypothetical protein
MPLLIVIVAVLAFLLWNRKASADVPVGLPRPLPSIPTPTVNPIMTGPGSTVLEQSNNALDNIGEAIAQQEGYYVQGSLANRTNNPGDIGTFNGNVGSYSTPGEGWDALNTYITSHAQAHPQWDFYDFAHYYLTGDTMGKPGPGQNPDAYAEGIANYVGVDPTQPVSSVLWGG